MKNLAIFGAGGFGKEVACLVRVFNEHHPEWNLIGFFDDGKEKGEAVSHYGTVLGGLNDLLAYPEDLSVVFAIGSPKVIKMISGRVMAENEKVNFPNLIHPECYFADAQTFKIGRGNVIMRGCSFSCDVEMGDFNQMNSISALAHDVKVGSYNVFMPLTRISGEVEIGDHNFFGINSIVLQMIKIKTNIRIGANSVLMTKPRKEGLYMGNPAKFTVL